MFILFTFNVVMHMIGFVSISLPLLLNISHLFFVSSPFFLSFILIENFFRTPFYFFVVGLFAIIFVLLLIALGDYSIHL